MAKSESVYCLERRIENLNEIKDRVDNAVKCFENLIVVNDKNSVASLYRRLCSARDTLQSVIDSFENQKENLIKYAKNW